MIGPYLPPAKHTGRPWAGRFNAMRRMSIFAATYAPGFVMFITPALINGFPLVYSDSGTYLWAAISGTIPVDRPIYYSLFLLALHWRTTLCPPVAVQAAIAIAVLDIFFRRNLAPLTRSQLAVQLCLVAGLTSLPFFVSEIMPDIFTPLMILSVCLLICPPRGMATSERLFIYAVCLAAICFHQANFLIATLTIIFAAPFIFLNSGWNQLIRRFAVFGSLLASGLFLLVLPNYIRYGEIVITPGSGTFLLAQLLDDFPDLNFLTTKCETEHYSICSQIPAIRHHQEAVRSMLTSEPTAVYFLWEGPLVAAGGWNALAPYAGSIAVGAILHEPGRFVLTSLEGFAHQLVRFDTGDGLYFYPPSSYISFVINNFFPTSVNRAYLTSRQETGRLHLEIIAYLHKVTVIIGLLVIILFLPGVFRANRALGVTVCTILLGMVANAAVTGALSSVADRYQSRVAGLVVVAAVMLAHARLTTFFRDVVATWRA